MAEKYFSQSITSAKNAKQTILVQGKDEMPMAVDIIRGNVVPQNYKKVVNLSKNETIYAQGDGVIKIAPFDNYYLFTIYSEINLEDVPVDLNNMGDFYLVFKDKGTEVRIKNFTNGSGVNLSAGEILFKISQEDAEKVLSMENDTFYVTSMISTNDSKSDETVIYSGKFIEYSKGNVDTLTDTINSLKKELNSTNALRDADKNEYQKQVNKLNEFINNLTNNNKILAEQLSSYKNLCEELSGYLNSDLLMAARQAAEDRDRNSTNLQDNEDFWNKLKEAMRDEIDASTSISSNNTTPAGQAAFDGLEDEGVIPINGNSSAMDTSTTVDTDKIDPVDAIQTAEQAKAALRAFRVKSGILTIAGVSRSNDDKSSAYARDIALINEYVGMMGDGNIVFSTNYMYTHNAANTALSTEVGNGVRLFLYNPIDTTDLSKNLLGNIYFNENDLIGTTKILLTTLRDANKITLDITYEDYDNDSDEWTMDIQVEETIAEKIAKITTNNEAINALHKFRLKSGKMIVVAVTQYSYGVPNWPYTDPYYDLLDTYINHLADRNIIWNRGDSSGWIPGPVMNEGKGYDIGPKPRVLFYDGDVVTNVFNYKYNVYANPDNFVSYAKEVLTKLNNDNRITL